MPDKCFQRTQEDVTHPRNSFHRAGASKRPEQGQAEQEMKGRDTDAKIRHELPRWDIKAPVGGGQAVSPGQEP